MRRFGMGGLWRHGDFLKLWAGHTVSQFGTQVSFLAVPLVAVVTLDASPVQVGILNAVGSVPALLVGLFAGVWVDRLRRRPILVWSDVGRAVVLGMIPLMALAGVLRVEYLYVVALVMGTLSLFFGVASGAYLPSLVRRDRLVDANSKLEVSRSAAEIGGPSLAGGLVQVFTAPVAILFDAVSYLISALFLAAIKTPEPDPQSRRSPEGSEEQGRILNEVGEGLRMLLGNATLRSLVACTGTITFFNAMIEAVFILYFVRELGLSAATIGLVFSIGGAGFLVGAALAGRVVRSVGLGRVLLFGPLVIGLSDLIIPLADGPRALVVGLLASAQFLFSVGLPIYRINEVSLRQTITPDRFLGRINSGDYFVREGLVPFGALLGGVLGGLIGLQTTLVIAAAGEMLAVFWILFTPLRFLRERPEEMVG